MSNSLKLNTKRTYGSAQNKYLNFCTLYDQSPLTATEHTLLLYVAYLYNQNLSHSTVHVYLEAVRYLPCISWI